MRTHTLALICVCAFGPNTATAQTLTELAARAGVESGLCVVIVRPQATELEALARDGRMLIKGSVR